MSRGMTSRGIMSTKGRLMARGSLKRDRSALGDACRRYGLRDNATSTCECIDDAHGSSSREQRFLAALDVGHMVSGVCMHVELGEPAIYKIAGSGE